VRHWGRTGEGDACSSLRGEGEGRRARVWRRRESGGEFFEDTGESSVSVGSWKGVGGTLSGEQERESGPAHWRGENAGSQGARASRGQNEATV
jgi:hypothetical protein